MCFYLELLNLILSKNSLRQITKLLCNWVFSKDISYKYTTQNPLNTKNGIGGSFLNDLVIEIL